MFINLKLFTAAFVLVICLAAVDFAQTETALTGPIESVEADLKGCIQLYEQKEFVIRGREDYLKNIRDDARKENCEQNAENLEFEKYSYIGIRINSGYCRRPAGLAHRFIRDKETGHYILTVSYTDPQGRVCRALSRYDFWLRVPQIGENEKVIFRIEPKN